MNSGGGMSLTASYSWPGVSVRRVHIPLLSRGQRESSHAPASPPLAQGWAVPGPVPQGEGLLQARTLPEATMVPTFPDSRPLLPPSVK